MDRLLRRSTSPAPPPSQSPYLSNPSIPSMERSASTSSVIASPSRSLSPSRSASMRRASAYLPSIFGTTLLGVSAATPGAQSLAPAAASTTTGAATKTRLRNDLLGLMNDTASADVQIVVGDDEVEFLSHRIILIARSEYFRKLLSTSNIDPRSPVRVELLFLDPDAFRIVLRYLYTAEEEDEATSLQSEDWRLILECYRITEFLGIKDRSPVYLSFFIRLFARLSRRGDKESCGDMWASADRYQHDDLLVGCAPEFWRLFGANGGTGVPIAASENSALSAFSHAAPSSRGEVVRLLNFGGRLEILVKVMNAIPPHLESPVGKFRIIRSWLMAQPPPPSPGDVDAAAEMAMQVNATLGRRASTATVVVMQQGDEAGQLRRLREEDGGEESGGESASPPTDNGFQSAVAAAAAAARRPSSAVGETWPPMDGKVPLAGEKPSGTVVTRKRRESHLSTITTSSYGGAASSVGAPSSAGWRKGMPTVGLSKEFGAYAASVASGGNGSAGRSPSVYAPFSPQGYGGGPGSSASSAGGFFVGGMELRMARQKVLIRLNLSGITATDLAEEVEPSGILSDRHLLALYRAAALEKEHPPLWMPVPIGFSQSQNHHTHHNGLSMGRRNATVNPRSKTVTLTASHLGPGFVTYCLADPVAAGRHVWTVVPLTSKEGLIGIGVSADAVLGSGASSSLGAAMSPLPSESFNFFSNIPTSPRPPSTTFTNPLSPRMGPTTPNLTAANLAFSPNRRPSSPAAVPSTLVNLPPAQPSTSTVSDALRSIGTAVTNLWQGNGDDDTTFSATRSRPSSPSLFANPPMSPSLAPITVPPGTGRFGDPQGFDPMAFVGNGRPQSQHLTPSSSYTAGPWMGGTSPQQGNGFYAPPPSSAVVNDTEGPLDYFSLDPDTLSKSLLQHQQQQGYKPTSITSPVGTLTRGGGTSALSSRLLDPSDADDILEPPGPQVPSTPMSTPATLTTMVSPASPIPTPTAPLPRQQTMPPRFVGEDGGWSLWSDGSLRVGRIFVGRLPAGMTFTRGTPVTVRLDMDARTLSFEVGGKDCGVAFRNLPSPMFPSVAFAGGVGVASANVTWQGHIVNTVL